MMKDGKAMTNSDIASANGMGFCPALERKILTEPEGVVMGRRSGGGIVVV